MRTLILLLLVACDYDAPLDPDAPGAANVLTGTLVLDDATPTGPTMVFLADAANPMPPLGTGRPVTFSTVSPLAWVGPEGGTRSAPFAVTGVPDGTWVVTALLDQDRDFHPLVPTLQGATCGDVAGTRLASLGDRTPAPVTVTEGELAAEIPVVLGSVVPLEKPAFTVVAEEDTLAPGLPFRLAAVGIDAAYGPGLSMRLQGPFNPANPRPCTTAFWVHLRDLDRDERLDPHPDYPPEAGVFDVWPRVYVQWLGEPVVGEVDPRLSEEAQVVGFDRSAEPEGVTWSAEAVPYAAELQGLFAEPQLLDALLNTPFPVPEMTAAPIGVWRRTDADGTSTVITDPTQVPGGAWSVTVLLESGQAWTIPNELDRVGPAAQALPAPGVTSDPDFSQAAFLTLPAP